MRFKFVYNKQKIFKTIRTLDTVFSRLPDDFFFVASWTSKIFSMVDSLICWNPVSLELSMYY